MSRIVFDIETLGRDWESLDEPVKDYLLRYAETDDEIKRVKETLSFYPLTGEIIAIGMLNPDKDSGTVYYQAPGQEPLLPFEEGGIRFEAGSEKEILGKFWQAVKGYKQFITFNGRGFDCPFILVRSALHKVKPTVNLMPNRYNDSHIDLLDQLTFFGAARKFSLDMWCGAFGIKSPKAEMKGCEVGDTFRDGRYMDIARYCAGDLRATAEILKIWENYIRF
jgi:DNA polymerase elongation subunit (family B)